MKFAEVVSQIASEIGKMEDAARKLPNAHLADILSGAKGRLVDAANHPDAVKMDPEEPKPVEEPKPAEEPKPVTGAPEEEPKPVAPTPPDVNPQPFPGSG